MSEIDIANYPCSMEQTILINVPFLFSSVWNIVSGFLNDETRAKFVFLSSAQEYEPYLKDLFSDDQIPVCYGGSSEFQLPKGGLLSDSGLIVPKPPEKFWNSTITVPAWSCWNKELVSAKDAGTIIWEFKTKGYDIGYGLYYKETKNSEEIVLIEVSRVKSHLITINGFHPFNKPGIYILRFDNSYSKWNSKELSYDVTLIDENK